MKTFISWSGSRSGMVADALRKWLPGVLQSVEPWVSGADIEPGARWHQALSVQLEQCYFGIICLTAENLQSPWLLYEAGALSKSVEGSSVVPYLLQLRKADVAGPLAHFQSVEANSEGTFALLQATNAVMARRNERPLSDEVLRHSHELWWPRLSEALQAAVALEIPSSNPAEARNEEDMLLEELKVPILERRDLLTDAQREILRAIEESGECSSPDLLRRFPKYSDSELHYRLEQLRSFMFITVAKSRNEADPRYTLRDSYRKAYDSRIHRRRMLPP